MREGELKFVERRFAARRRQSAPKAVDCGGHPATAAAKWRGSLGSNTRESPVPLRLDHGQPSGTPARRAASLVVAVVGLLAGCAAPRAEVADPVGETAVDCPATHEIVLQTCSGPQPVGYGSLPSKPLEWGATRAGALYFGRLVCPGGGLALSERVVPERPLAEGVEAWQVRCPGNPTPHLWYTTARRCGNPCPPDGLTVIPQSALQRYLASVAAFDEGDAQRALRLVDVAVGLAPENELLTLWKATMLEQTGHAAEAVPLFEAAVRMNPDAPAHKLFLARSQRAIGHEQPYRAAVADLLGRLPPGHALIPELQCLQADLLKRDGKLPEAQTLAATACKGGHADCCGRN